MAAKRNLASLTESEHDYLSSSPPSQPSNKRARNAHGSGQKKSSTSKEPATDVTYGQRCCFPGLGESAAYSDEDLDLEDESDALAYLQSVRQEASSIPHLLVAPKSGPQLPPPQPQDDDDPDDAPVDRSIYEDGQGDTRGYYHDGAYTAAPDDADAVAVDHNTTTTKHDPQQQAQSSSASSQALSEAYFAALSARFLALRRHLHQPPPPAAVAALPASSSPAVGPLGASSRAFAVWSARLRRADPRPAQVAAMPKDAVLRVLRVLLGDRRLLRRGAPVAERTSRWLWALLARLPDRGEMDHVEVGHVREVGKRAALLLWSLREMALLREEVEGGGGYNDDEDEDEDEDEAELLGPHADGAGEEAWVGGDDNGRDGVDDTSNGQQDRELEKPEVAGAPARRPQDETPAQLTSQSGSAPDPVHMPSCPSTASTSPPNAVSSDPTKPTNDDDDDEDVEDGEVTDASAPMDLEPDAGAALEAARARLLASLDGAGATTDADGNSEKNDRKQSASKDAETDDNEPEPEGDPARARMNARATLNMILTVAGEFYGQRDLLEFRDPFHGV